jgi:hypothetical protein
MISPRKKPGVAFWATVVVVVVLVAYPLSFGPACWLAGTNGTAMDVIPNLYYPILWLAEVTRTEISPGVSEQSTADDCIEWYATLGRRDGLYPGLRPDGGTMWYRPPEEDPRSLFGISPAISEFPLK